jgi:N-acetylmuramoyl-L-alanine amidase
MIFKKMKKLKIALVVGHTSTGDKGAFSAFLNKSEYDYNLAVAKRIMEIADENIEYKLYTHTLQSYANRQAALASMVNKENFDYIFELHFNAASPSANGTECLYYYNSKKGKTASQIISKQIVKDFSTTLRGVEGAKALVNSADRGFGFVQKMKATAVIIEPFFGSNQEANKFKDIDKYACSLQNAFRNLE